MKFKLSFFILLIYSSLYNLWAQGDPNILVDYPDIDPTFESGNTKGLWGGSTVVKNNAYGGNNAIRLGNSTSSESGFELKIDNLSPRNKYVFSAYIKVANNGKINIGAKEFGGTKEVVKSTSSASYQKVSVTFTTGTTSSAKIFIYNPPSNNKVAYADNLELLDEGPSNASNLAPIDTNEYKLIFSDEFNVDGPIDRTKWQPERGFKRNNEEQYYLPDNLSQKNGNLVIKAIRERYENENYDPNSTKWTRKRKYAKWTSGSIATFNRFNFLYGRVECRAKVTNLTGTWPAIWTVGEGDPEGTGCQTGDWPAGGEIDIMENYGGKILGNFAVAANGRWNAKWDARAVKVSDLGDPNFADKYHIWTLDWTEDKMSIYIDGILINEFDPNTTNNSGAYSCPNSAPFKNIPQVLWLNLALGGNAGGSTANLPNETSYLVDYIRVYQKKKNIINDPGFESGKSSYLWGGSKVVNNNTNTGRYAARLNNTSTGSGYEAIINGLKPDTDYVFSAYTKCANSSGSIGVKNYGRTSKYYSFKNTKYNKVNIQFRTGIKETSATVYVYNNPSSKGYIYVDDLSLNEANLLEDPGFETGKSKHLWGGSTVIKSQANKGSYCAKLEESDTYGGGYQILIPALESNTDYVFSAYVKNTKGKGHIGVKNYGREDKYKPFQTNTYERVRIRFKTGENSTSATLYVYNPKDIGGAIYIDDLALVKVTESSLSRSNLKNPEEESIGFPNPIVNEIDFMMQKEGVFHYRLLSMSGQVMNTGKATNAETLSVDNLPNGFYLLELNFGEIKNVHKIIIRN